MRSRLFIIGLVSFILLLATFYVIYLTKGHDWRLTYNHNSSEPYGTAFIRALLADLDEGHRLKGVNKPLKAAMEEGADDFNYVLIGENSGFSRESMEALVQHVFDGNQAFIATSSIPKRLLGRVLDPGNKDFYYKRGWQQSDFESGFPMAGFGKHSDTSVRMGFDNPFSPAHTNIPFYRQYETNRLIRGWAYLDSLKAPIAQTRLKRLGHINDTATNFFRVELGDGHFYFHLNPIVFTNYHINREAGFRYARQAFAFLDEKPIYFDQFERGPPKPDAPDKPRFGQSPLQFILSQSSLRWAWYWGLASLLLFVVFQGKRRQRVIPVMAGYGNETLAFVRTIGQMHRQHKAIKGIVQKQMTRFLAFLRDQYGLHTQTDEETLAQKAGYQTGLDPQRIRSIFTKYHEIQRKSEEEATETDLQHFYGMIQHFINQTKA